ncbi:MAG: PssD/Cps14F family polysaccharide biosynthesis glycosyltransferase [archaeon]
MSKKGKKICIAASAGGHLAEALQLKSAWKNKQCFYISDNRVNAISLAKKEKVYFVKPARRNPLNLAICFAQTFSILFKENPSVIISTGAEIGYPVMVIGALTGKKVIYIESLARINSPSLTGKLVYPFVKDFYIQWPQAKKWFPKAKYAGSVFE